MSSMNSGDMDLSKFGIESMPIKAPAPEIVRPPRIAKPADKRGWWWGTGRRKTAVARIRMKPAAGADAVVTVIGRDPKKVRTVDQYFAEERDRREANLPLTSTNLAGKFQIVVRCAGGGYMGQAAAIKLAIARALIDYDPSTEPVLRQQGLLTRDAREVERKKYGQAGARRRFQFSKR
jgi:small subunit ribosomal protein S9